jgi:hypothetical protein
MSMKELSRIQSPILHYHFPSIGITYTDIPKNGSTSLKNFFINLERFPDRKGGAAADPKFERVRQVHGREIARRYTSRKLVTKGSEGNLKILVLRHPVDRVLSAWVNLFLVGNPGVNAREKYEGHSFIPQEPLQFDELSASFEKFVSLLSSDRSFLRSDVHWAPQTSFFDSVKEYDLVISMDQIPLLPKALGDHYKFRGPKKMPLFPQLNVSRISFANGLYTKESLDLVSHIYRNDYESLREAGILVEPKNVASDVELSKLRDAFHKSRESIILARQENRIIRMEDQLDAVYRSLSWRMTAPLRFLFRGLK